MSVLEARSRLGVGVAAIDALESDESYRKSKLGFWFWASCVWLALLILSATFAGLLPLKDPNTAFAGVSRSGPSAAHWFGADNIGHDIFSRTIYGARRSLVVVDRGDAARHGHRRLDRLGRRLLPRARSTVPSSPC